MLVFGAIEKMLKIGGKPGLGRQKAQGGASQTPWPGQRKEMPGMAHPV